MTERTDYRWWAKDKKDNRHKVAWDAFKRIEANDSARRTLDERHMLMYSSAGANVGGTDMASTLRRTSGGALALNVVKAACDTVQSQVAKTRPRPVFLTNGGNRSLMKRAKLLGRYVEGQLYLSKMPDIAPRVFLDAAVFGTGVIKVYRKKKEICLERTFPGEIFVDQAEGLHGKPHTLYQRKLVNKDVLKEQFPKHAAAIDRSVPRKEQSPIQLAPESLNAMAEVVEAWHLGNESRRILFVEGAVLEDKPWKYEDFPFVFLRWSNELLGFWGGGLAKELTSIQVEINQILRKIQTAFRRLAVPWVLVEQGSQINKAHLNNQIGAIIPYRGKAPVVRANQTMSPEVFAHLNWLYQRAFDHVGVSQYASGGEKPVGVTSGVGIREAVEVQAGRFALKSRYYEDMHLAVALWIVRLGKEIATQHKDYTVVAARDKFTIDDVKWSDVDMELDAFVLKVFPSSSLPTEPTGRLATIIEMINAGIIDIPRGQRLLDFPDLEQDVSLERAASDNIDRMIENILDEGNMEVPEPFMDLQLFTKKAQAAYQRALDQGVPEQRLRILRRAIETARTMQKAAMAEQAMMQAPLQAGSALPAGPAGAPPQEIQSGDGVVPVS